MDVVDIETEQQQARHSRVAELYALHMPGAVRLALVLTGSRDDAEDLAQEAFVRVAGRFMDLRNPDSFPAYLRRAVVNESKMRYRRSRVAKRHVTATRPLPDPLLRDSGIEDRDRLTKALFTLPERQRAALALRFYCDLSESDTAEILGCRPGTVKSLISRGTEAMRVALGGEP